MSATILQDNGLTEMPIPRSSNSHFSHSLKTLCQVLQRVLLQMAPSTRNYRVRGLKVAIITVASIFLLTTLLPKSVDSVQSSHNNESSDDLFLQSKMVLGSRPPGCQNKCLNCRPCIATLVIPVHKTKRFSLSSHGEESDSYYLLSWKCRCGNKLFQP
ncbi:hypothetical protein DVH24_031285 [Malus domestica]|uniref:Epidermal patterning factor-like protein n=2 Tax=Malus TaxID=3749 RepID=A0A498HGF0_MALDO|nr:hypothetical protein DVH24_031285 [Malus domestica]